MRKFLYIVVFLFPLFGFGAIPTVSVFPEKVIQGEPVKVTVENASSVATVQKISFDGKPATSFLFQGKPTAFIGIDLNKKPGEYVVSVTLTDGMKLSKIISVGAREKVFAPIDIPQKLGGNTVTSAKAVVSSLVDENRILYAVRTFPKALWTENFKFPVLDPRVTDTYGYYRETVGEANTHKGTDFHAEEWTQVKVMNRGIIRLARTFRVYGRTVIVDHGGGLMTLYMHLSKIKVNEGELVKQGQLIAFSGKTGYAEKPHLHISVWIDKVSIDPMKFMALFSQ